MEEKIWERWKAKMKNLKNHKLKLQMTNLELSRELSVSALKT